MIRRDVKSADGAPAWVLISQLTHAWLAHELAVHWQAIDDGSLDVNLITETILLHDDGWQAWEDAPTIDAATGMPPSFLEMPNDVAIDIWRQSIDGAAELGPLSQWMVAEHFCRLRHAAPTDHDASVREFLATYEVRCRGWLATWQAEDPARHRVAVAERALQWLQFFDRLSLWLCMAEPTVAKTFESPRGESIRMTPISSSGDTAMLTVHPWPWHAIRLEKACTTVQIPARQYASDAELRAALAARSRVTLNWVFVPC